MPYPVSSQAKRPGPGGALLEKDITSGTVVKTGSGTVYRVFVNTAPSAAGGVYDTGNATAGAVDAVNITKTGSGYVSAPAVTFSAPSSGTTATGTANLSQGTVVSITITNPGSGYTSAPTVTIAAPPAGVTATATAIIGGPVASTLICNVPTTEGPREIIGNFYQGLYIDPGTGGVVSVSYE